MQRGARVNNTAFNVLCNIAHVVSQEQNIVLDLEITDDCIIARVIPIEYLAEEDEGDE
jgi:hypothetical protein